MEILESVLSLISVIIIAERLWYYIKNEETTETKKHFVGSLLFIILLSTFVFVPYWLGNFVNVFLYPEEIHNCLVLWATGLTLLLVGSLVALLVLFVYLSIYEYVEKYISIENIKE